MARWLGAAVVVGLVAASGTLGAAGGTERGGRAVQARIAHLDHGKPTEQAALAAPEPGYRAHFGRSDMYIPTFFHPTAGTYDLIVHFHGLREAQETNIERTHLNAVVVSINIGMGSGPYENAFKDGWRWRSLLSAVEQNVEKSGRAPGARIGRIALSAWSAGYGAVSALLRDKDVVARVDAVLLADGLHSNFKDRKHEVDDAPLQKYARIAEAAMKGEKLFALTHSAVPTYGYPNTTQTIGELLKMTNVPKNASRAEGPRSMRQIYVSDSGDFHVKGFEGTGVKDHIDHIWGMNETMLPYLKARWER
jgi:hypothetical protein